MIRFEGFGWQFAGAQAWALREVCLRIERGEFVTVAGPSGSGKTTLAEAMCGLLVGRQAGVCEGSACVAGEDVSGTPLHTVAATIGLVQQNPEAHFATLTVSDEIAFGMENHCLAPEEIRRRSAEAMELLSITHLRDRELSTLSGGEKQRVAVASIVAGRPDALVLDEPTASLDPGASRALFHSLAELCRQTGLTVVIIEHKLAHLLPLKPRLICLDEGRVVSDGYEYLPDRGCPAWLAGPGPEEVTESATDVATAGDEPIVEVSSVTIDLGGQTVLRDVSLQVGPDEVVAIMGPNGGGKSTLLQCLLGLVQPQRGSIRVCGAVVSPRVVSRLARKVGLVFQNADHQLMADTVWHESVFAIRNLKIRDASSEEDADRLLELAGLSERRDDHPFRLSWGKKRRLNLISAVLHGPRLLLLDEPFAGQDWENVALLLDTIRGVLKVPPARDRPGSRSDGYGAVEQSPSGGACLMVTHDPRVVVGSCTRVLFVAGGQVIVDAPVRQAFQRLRETGYEAYVP